MFNFLGNLGLTSATQSLDYPAENERTGETNYYPNVSGGDLNYHVKNLQNTKPKTSEDIKKLRTNFDLALQTSPPYGFKMWGGAREVQNKIFPFATPPTPHDPKIPELYKSMRNILTFQKNNKYITEEAYQKIDDGVLTSAVWYWNNVEKPALGIKSSSTHDPTQYGISKEEMDEKSQKAKVAQWGIIIGSMGVGLTLLYFAFRKPSEKAKKSNPRLPLKRPNYSVTHSRVRKNTRKRARTNPNGHKPIIIRSNRPSAVGAYRKKYNSSQRKNRPAPKTGRLRLKR